MDRKKLLKVCDNLRALADSIEALCDEGQPKKEKPEVTLEQVRGVLAEKSRSGHTAQVREIIRRHGADCLSGLDPKEYPAVLAEAEVL